MSRAEGQGLTMALATALCLLGSTPPRNARLARRRIQQGRRANDGDTIGLPAPLTIGERLTSCTADHFQRVGPKGELAELGVQEEDGSAEART